MRRFYIAENQAHLWWFPIFLCVISDLADFALHMSH